MISVAIFDPHELVREAIARVLDDHAQLRVVAAASDARDAMESVRLHQPSVIVSEINLPGMDAVEILRRCRRLSPGSRVIFLSEFISEPFPSALLRAGACGYVSKACSPEDIADAVLSVREHGQYLSDDVANNIAKARLIGSRSPFARLSCREFQMVALFVSGIASTEIAERLFLSPRTVSTYRYRIYEKLGVHGDVELARLAYRHGLFFAMAGQSRVGGMELRKIA